MALAVRQLKGPIKFFLAVLHDSSFRPVLKVSASMYVSRLSSSKPPLECNQDQMPFINGGWLEPFNQIALCKKIMQFFGLFKGEQVKRFDPKKYFSKTFTLSDATQGHWIVLKGKLKNLANVLFWIYIKHTHTYTYIYT